MQRTQKELPLEFLTLLGYRLQYGAQRSKQQKEAEERWHFRDFSDSIGLSVAEDGRVARVVPEKPADRAGLYEGVQVLGVDGRKFSLQRMEDGVAGSVASRSVKLLVLEGDVLRDVDLGLCRRAEVPRPREGREPAGPPGSPDPAPREAGKNRGPRTLTRRPNVAGPCPETCAAATWFGDPPRTS